MANNGPASGGRREATQRAILNATAQLVAEKGVDGFTISEVAQRGNINRALIYHYFKNRDTLVFEAIRFIVRRYDEVTQGSGDDDIERSLRLHIEHPEIARFILHLFLTDRELPLLSQRITGAIETLQAVKAEFAPESEIDPALAVLSGWLLQITWSVAREEMARHLGVTVDQADERMLTHLRNSSRLYREAVTARTAQTR
jgi:AcrR family transcriptional regulator